jgi:hypothetical protein
VRVSVMIHSGRPDPSWIVPDALARALSDRLRQAELIGPAKPSGARLGYRGVRIEQRGPLGPSVWEASGGNLFRAGRCYRDRQREIERRALASGLGQGDAQLDELLRGLIAGLH